MVRTNRVTVLRHSGISDPTLTTQNRSDDYQAIRRLYKLQTCFCVGHLILIAVTTTTLGIYVSEHVRHS